MGIVTALIMGNDNKIRLVKLRKADGHVDTYSIKLLYPLEIHANAPEPRDCSDGIEKQGRQKRNAAEKACKMIKNIIENE